MYPSSYVPTQAYREYTFGASVFPHIDWPAPIEGTTCVNPVTEDYLIFVGLSPHRAG